MHLSTNGLWCKYIQVSVSLSKQEISRYMVLIIKNNGIILVYTFIF
jgi:hypothetical protein